MVRADVNIKAVFLFREQRDEDDVLAVLGIVRDAVPTEDIFNHRDYPMMVARWNNFFYHFFYPPKHTFISPPCEFAVSIPLPAPRNPARVLSPFAPCLSLSAICRASGMPRQATSMTADSGRHRAQCDIPTVPRLY